MFRGVKSLFGPYLGIEQGTNVVVSKHGFLSGAPGSQIPLPSPERVVFFDDFMGDLLADEWNFVEGTDSSTSAGAIVAAVNGTLVITPGDSDGTIAADYAAVNAALNWKANAGDLVFQARVKLAEITSVSAFIGFTDTVAHEQPIHSAASANTLTTVATDAVGFMFDTAMGTDNWWAVGVANDVDATAQNLGVAPVADTYETFRIELSTAGVAKFFRNGLEIGSGAMSGAVTPTVALTPHFGVRPLSAAAGKLLTVDYSLVAATRV
jgi:hypothetical protein